MRESFIKTIDLGGQWYQVGQYLSIAITSGGLCDGMPVLCHRDHGSGGQPDGRRDSRAAGACEPYREDPQCRVYGHGCVFSLYKDRSLCPLLSP